MVLTDALMANYKMTLHEAYCKFPLSAALALWPALCARNGWKHEGPDYVAREAIAARARMRNHLDKNYRLKNDSPPPSTPHP